MKKLLLFIFLLSGINNSYAQVNDLNLGDHDIDADGYVSSGEFSSYYFAKSEESCPKKIKHRKKMFDRFDKNSDGQLTEKEASLAFRMFKPYKKDLSVLDDGILTENEFTYCPRLNPNIVFRKLDVNQDGLIDGYEIDEYNDNLFRQMHKK